MLPEPGGKPTRTPVRTPKVIGTGTLENDRWFDVYRGNTLIGTTNLEVIVEPGARVAGLFHPTPAFSAVRSIFALYRHAVDRNDAYMLREFVRRRDQLKLRVLLAGKPLDAQVELISTWTAAIHVVHIACRDPRMWD